VKNKITDNHQIGFSDIEDQVLTKVATQEILKKALRDPLIICIINHKLSGLDADEIADLTLIPENMVRQTFISAWSSIRSYVAKHPEGLYG